MARETRRESRGVQGAGVIVEDVELKGEVRGLLGDGGVNAAGVDLKEVELVGGELGDGAVGGGADLEGALHAVVGEDGGAEDFGEVAGGVAAEEIHLEEAVAGDGEGLGEDEVVEGGGLDVRDAVGVAGDGDGGGEAGDGEGAVELGEGGAGGGADPVARAEPCGDGDDEGEDEGDDGGAGEAARGAPGGGWLGCGFGGGQGGGYGEGAVRVFVFVHATGLQAWFLIVRMRGEVAHALVECKWCGFGALEGYGLDGSAVEVL